MNGNSLRPAVPFSPGRFTMLSVVLRYSCLMTSRPELMGGGSSRILQTVDVSYSRVPFYVQGWAKMWSPCCENSLDKLRQKW